MRRLFLFRRVHDAAEEGPQTLAELARAYRETDIGAVAAFFAGRFRPETAYLQLVEY